MFRFAKPDGSKFDLDYRGPIFAFDSDGVVVANTNDSPENWDDWVPLIGTVGDSIMFQRALASAWAATSLCERMAVEMRTNAG